MKNKWLCELVFEDYALDGMMLNDLIAELKAFQDDGFTHCAGFIDHNGVNYLSVKRGERDEDAKKRKEQEKLFALKAKAKKEADERKLFNKLKKKYGGV